MRFVKKPEETEELPRTNAAQRTTPAVPHGADAAQDDDADR